MNFLRTYTEQTDQADTFDVHWTNTVHMSRGLLRIRIIPDIPDRQIAAELSAIRYLLEDKRVLGRSLISGHNVRLEVSQGAIRKLAGQRSAKAHLAPYTSFLTTRFRDCQIVVSKRTDWFADELNSTFEQLQVTGPCRETIRIYGLGEVVVCSHALQRFAERHIRDTDPGKHARNVWRDLMRLTSDPCVQEVERRNRNAPMRLARPGYQEGRYFLNRQRNLIMVVTDRPYEGLKLVTIYPATKEFVALTKVA